MNASTGTDTTATKAKSGSNPSRVIAIRQPANPDKVELWHSVYVVGPENGPGFAQMFARAKCHKASSIETADLVVFTGGYQDIHPALYGVRDEDCHESMNFESQECIDLMLQYIEVWQECFYTGTPMIGICLGAQFLHVMNGGVLYQDVDNHNKDHPLYCNLTGKLISVSSSVHHQAVKYNQGMTILGTVLESNERWLDRTRCELVVDKPNDEDIEAFFYGQTISLGFQGHPEYQGYPEYTEWCLKLIQNLIINNDKLALQNNILRMKDEWLKRRNFSLSPHIHAFIKEYS